MRYLRFKQQVHSYRHDIFRFALHLLGNVQDAEDATQDVLLRFWDHFDAIQKEKIKSWLMTSMHHKCIDMIRRRRPEYPLNEALELPERETPSDVYDQNERCRLLRVALADLPESLKAPVILRDIEGYSYGAIAEILGQPENTVSVSIHRGRRLLREKLRGVYMMEEQ